MAKVLLFSADFIPMIWIVCFYDSALAFAHIHTNTLNIEEGICFCVNGSSICLICFLILFALYLRPYAINLMENRYVLVVKAIALSAVYSELKLSNLITD